MTDFEDYDSDEPDGSCEVCGDPLCPGCESSVQLRLLKLALLPIGIVAVALIFRTLFLSGGPDIPEKAAVSASTTAAVSASTTAALTASTQIATTTTAPSESAAPAGTSSPDWDRLARSVVFIEAGSPCNWRGSGTIVLDGSYLLTNHHVASSGECTLRVGLTSSLSSTPEMDYFAKVLISDETLDLAVLRLVDRTGRPITVPGHDPVTIDYTQPALGSRLATLGYPALGSYDAGMTITFTSGTFSGIDYTDGEFYKTDAQMRSGVSGGAAFSEKGLFLGVPTGGLIDEDSQAPVGINLIRPAKFAKPLLEQAQK